MGGANPIDYFVNVDNQYAFKLLCHNKSLQAFEIAIREERYPSRLSLVYLGAYNALASAFCVIGRIGEIALYIWNLSNQKDHEGSSVRFHHLASIIGLSAFQLSIPIMCTAIRISACLVGLLVPRLALEGWKIAEAGEELSYLHWSEQQKNIAGTEADRSVFVEIIPENAIAHLGIERTRSVLGQTQEVHQRIEGEIHMNFLELLNHILSANSRCFKKLFHYDHAVVLPKMVSRDQRSYTLSHDTMLILRLLKEMKLNEDRGLSEEESSSQEESSRLLIDTMVTQLTIQQIHRLFVHVHLNLHDTMICEELKLDAQLMEQQFMLLSDLFSLRFEFGRAHFYHPACHLHPFIRV